jgi:predicted membrane channel-forming protein YqfA (hemolysin III family)
MMKPKRLRILLGVVLLVAGLAVYALLAMQLAVTILPENRLVELLFYAVAGTVWLFPAARLTRWMQAPEPPERR